MIGEFPIRVLPHAIARADERGLKLSRKEIRRDVREALRAGRFAGVPPAWCETRGVGYSAFAWNADETVVYALVGGETSWHVKTVMVRTS